SRCTGTAGACRAAFPGRTPSGPATGGRAPLGMRRLPTPGCAAPRVAGAPCPSAPGRDAARDPTAGNALKSRACAAPPGGAGGKEGVPSLREARPSPPLRDHVAPPVVQGVPQGLLDRKSVV